MGSSSGGGDGGAAQSAQIKAEQDRYINELNRLFGVADPMQMVDKSKYSSTDPAAKMPIFNKQESLDQRMTDAIARANGNYVKPASGQGSNTVSTIGSSAPSNSQTRLPFGSKIADSSEYGRRMDSSSDATGPARFGRGMNGNNADAWGNQPPSPVNNQAVFDQRGYDAAISAANDENAFVKSMRESFYQDTGDDVFNLKKESLDKSKLNADRELKFQLARTGNFGGSNQIDQGNNVAENYDRGLLDIGNLKQSTINNARANDETSRVDLIGRIRAGMNQADALNSAASQQQSNLAQARDNALSQTITDYFGGMKYLQGQNQYQQDFATAQKKYATQAKAFNGTVGTI